MNAKTIDDAIQKMVESFGKPEEILLSPSDFDHLVDTNINFELINLVKRLVGKDRVEQYQLKHNS